jgi:hypothetical protein
MNTPKSLPRLSPRKSSLIFLSCVLLVAAFWAADARAAAWSGIEPFKSRRADVERALGAPLASNAGEAGTLQFRVAGGMVTIAFVDRRFVETKKLAPELEGTVLQIILQHDAATDTPESLNLTKNNRFKREDRDGVTVFRNTRDGVFYTFVNNRLKTTRYTPTAEQQTGSQK